MDIDEMLENMNIEVPAGVGATMQLADPFLLNYYEQLDNRTLWLDRELRDDGVEIVKKILRWNFEDNDKGVPVEQRRPIKLFLLSPGGDIYQMLALVDAIRLSKTPVYTCAVSLAASAACAILLAGHKRFALPYAHAMWHSGSAGVSGPMNQVQDATKHLEVVEDQMTDFFLARTKVTARTLKKYKDRDWYMTAKEMLDNGLVDKIVESVDEII